MDPLQATLFGVVEGLTEFLPVSSTGHLILVSHLFGLRGAAVKTFEVVIQAGALGAVLGLYRDRVRAMGRGVWGRDADGARLFGNLLVSFLPAALVGALLHRVIKAWLFSVTSVAAALMVGGLVILAVERWSRVRPTPAGTRGGPGPAPEGWTLASISRREALLIGCAQCLALWPGTSRAMVTIVAGRLLHWPAAMAAEYSFLLALPTLGAATVFDLVMGGQRLAQEVSGVSILCGFAAAAGVAALAIRGFLQYLTRHGLVPFGWYRLALALGVLVFVPG